MGLEDGYEYQLLRGHGETGFWESLAFHAKASVDWCELNYDVSPTLAMTSRCMMSGRFVKFCRCCFCC